MTVEVPVAGQSYVLRPEPGCEHERLCHGYFPALNGQVAVYERDSPEVCHPFKVRTPDGNPHYMKATELETQ